MSTAVEGDTAMAHDHYVAAAQAAAIQQDPYPHLSAMVREGEYHHAEGRCFVYSRRLATAVLKGGSGFAKRGQHGAASVVRFTPEQEERVRRTRPSEPGMLTMIDPPSHTRLRRLVSLALTPRAIGRQQAIIESVLENIFSGLDPTQTVDFVSKIGEPFPGQVIGEMIGLPLPDREWFAKLTQDATPAFEVETDFESALAGAQARREIVEYLAGLVAERTPDPDSDALIDRLQVLAASDKESAFEDPAELPSLLATMYVAGFQTSMHMLGNGLNLFIEHPEQAEILRQNPDLGPQAVNEVLRFDPPLMYAGYIADDTVDIEGMEVRPDEHTTVVIGAANRDPRAYDNPDVFDIALQRDKAPITFGGGAHFCLGAALARLEGDLFFRTVLSRYPNVTLAGTPVRAKSLRLRGFDELPVILAPSG